MRRTGIALLDNQETKRSLLNKLARTKLPLNIVDRLVGLEQEHLGKSRRHGIWKQFDEIFSEATNRDDDEPTEQVRSHVHSSHPTA